VSVQFGIDRYLNEAPPMRNARIALVTNHAACTSSYLPSRQALLGRGFQVTRLFSPEHGLQTAGADGQAMVDGMDLLTGLPVKSLYGVSLKPSAEDLQDIDIVLVDLPDVGCRCYTYLWTMTYVMEACAESGKTLIVLDRPNPISGAMDLAEGPGLTDESCASFIGRWNIPLRHSCTIGELARFWAGTKIKDLDLRVISANGWSRKMFYHDWASSFVPTSPAIASAEACLLYPGLCLSEATNLSEGRGTAMAFRVLGAPWMHAQEVADEFNRLQLPGITARAITFAPDAAKYQGQACNGIMLHATETRYVRPVFAGIALIKLIRDLHLDNFRWATYPTHVNPTGEKHLDRLLGIADAESLFDLQWNAFCETAKFLLDCAQWKEQIAPYLLYE
jgi:uncharacterized protein YbbC (DUF1343 family)